MADRTSSAIKEARGFIRVLSGSERDRAIAEAREKAQMDKDSMIGDARQDGWDEGFQEGLRRGAENALREGMSVETVVKICGLSLEEVKRLKGGI